MRILIPGCWNRAVYGDDADCHCPKPMREQAPEMSLQEQIDALKAELKNMKAEP